MAQLIINYNSKSRIQVGYIKSLLDIIDYKKVGTIEFTSSPKLDKAIQEVENNETTTYNSFEDYNKAMKEMLKCID